MCLSNLKNLNYFLFNDDNNIENEQTKKSLIESDENDLIQYSNESNI